VQIVFEFFGVNVVATACSQGLVQVLDDELAAVVVEPGPLAGALDQRFAVGDGKPQSLDAIGDNDIFAERSLALTHGLTDDFGHL